MPRAVPQRSSILSAGGAPWYAPPSWAASAVFHATVLVALWWMSELPPPGDINSAGTLIVATLGLDSDEEEYFDDAGGESTAAFAADPAPASTAFDQIAAPAQATGSVAAIFDEPPPVDTSDALPSQFSASEVGGDLASVFGAQGLDAAALTSGNGSTSGVGSGVGRVRTQIYGISAEGSKFVYVFDRSSSMGSFNAFASAKNELLASLESLGEIQQFQVVFYNERPTIMSIGGQSQRLFFGTAPNKRFADQFVRGVTADGATNHEQPLIVALKFRPDVIFFLTDADQPGLDPKQMDRIRQANSGTAIHTIEFGLGPQPRRENFLQQLARENGGRYVYRDVTRLRSRTSP